MSTYYVLPVQLTTSRIGNRTRLIHTLAICVTIHTYCASVLSPVFRFSMNIWLEIPLSDGNTTSVEAKKSPIVRVNVLTFHSSL